MGALRGFTGGSLMTDVDREKLVERAVDALSAYDIKMKRYGGMAAASYYGIARVVLDAVLELGKHKDAFGQFDYGPLARTIVTAHDLFDATQPHPPKSPFHVQVEDPETGRLVSPYTKGVSIESDGRMLMAVVRIPLSGEYGTLRTLEPIIETER